MIVLMAGMDYYFKIETIESFNTIMQNIQNKHEIGRQYPPDDTFKEAARLHQSKYRANILKVDYDEYGNRLSNKDSRQLLNYYDYLDVRQILRHRYPKYSKKRDADMLRSEHIPFNLFAPLVNRSDLAEQILNKIISRRLHLPIHVEIEWAPKPAENYLGDHTSFDAYIEARDDREQLTGIGIEVKYTEQGYRIGESEKQRINNPDSLYWKVTRQSKVFSHDTYHLLAGDDLRQIWRNHLIGLAMKQAEDIDQFILLTIYPSGNRYMAKSISRYRNLLTDKGKNNVLGLTFEDFIESINGGDEIMEWKEYLQKRYIVEPADGS